MNFRVNCPIKLYILTSAILIGLNLPNYVQTYTQPDLYSPTDDVIRLNSTTFIPTVFHDNKNITYMVQFYNTFCGHCQMFSPIYKELGTRVKNWTSVFRLAAIDCSKDENVMTCSENKIEGYPTVYLYPPNAKYQEPSDAPENLRSFNIEWTVDDIEETIIDYLANLTSVNRDYSPVVRALQPITATTPEELNRVYHLDQSQNDLTTSADNNDKQDLMFLVESEKSYLGRRLIVEYFRINQKLELRRIKLDNQQLLKSLLSSEDYAKLDDNQPILMKLGGLVTEGFAFRKAQILVRGEEKSVLPTAADHERSDFIYNRFKMFFEHYYSIELESEQRSAFKLSEVLNTPKTPSLNEITNDNELDIHHILQSEPKLRNKVFALDLLKGISYMITHEMKVKGDLTSAEFNTVRNMLTILKKFLPLEKWDSSLHNFIVDMRTRLDDNRSFFETRGVKAQEMRDILDLSGADAIRLRYNRENWISCHESDRNQKGYTCSLWLLFHTLTLGEYSKAAPVRTKPTLVLNTMRDYIIKFLGCTVCSSNYVKESESLETSITGRNSSVLWLWYTHNKISQRLNNEKPPKDRKPLIDVIFPSHDNCVKCVKTRLSEVGVDGKTLEDIEWDMDSVMTYLSDTYKPERVITPIEATSLFKNMKTKFNYDVSIRDTNIDDLRPGQFGADMNKSTVEQWNIQSIFSTSDISLCLFLYLTCIVIVAAVCMALNPKLKRFNKTK